MPLRSAGLGAVALSLLSASAAAQTVAGGAAVTITPSLSLSETITDNVQPGGADKRSEAISQVSPGLRMSARTGRVRGSLDYSLNAIAYARDSSRNQVQHALAANGSAELVERHAFVDARASISQQVVSAFGLLSPSNSAINPNSTEVRSFSVSPYVRGNIAGVVDVEGRWDYSRSDSSSGGSYGSSGQTTSLRASGGRGPLGWSVDHQHSVSDYSGGRETATDRSTLTLSYRPDIDWRLTARVGRETTDVLSLDKASNTTWGGGIDWSPSPRTSVSLQGDHRYYGNSYSASVQYRMPRTVWRLSSSRGASNDPGLGAVGLDLIAEYQRLFDALAPFEPDPVRRDLLVRQFMGPRAGFLARGVTLDRRHEIGAVWSGLRGSVGLTYYQSQSSRLDRLSPAVDDLTNISALSQHGWSLTSSYRLTPSTGLSFGYTRSTTADAGPQLGNDQQTFNLGLTSQIAWRTSLSLNMRHVSYDNATRPYTENAATATLSFQF